MVLSRLRYVRSLLPVSSFEIIFRFLSEYAFIAICCSAMDWYSHLICRDANRKAIASSVIFLREFCVLSQPSQFRQSERPALYQNDRFIASSQTIPSGEQLL